jgi:hypothetical protein
MVAYFGVLRSSLARPEAPKPFEKVPEGQTYVGVTVCGACHLDQLTDWRKTPHARTTRKLPDKYKEDKSCLKCHSTAFGQPTGFKSIKETPHLMGTSCEVCHGPASKHVEVAKMFIGKKPTQEEEKFIRSSVYKIPPRVVCFDCHISKAHKEHPDFD